MCVLRTDHPRVLLLLISIQYLYDIIIVSERIEDAVPASYYIIYTCSSVRQTNNNDLGGCMCSSELTSAAQNYVRLTTYFSINVTYNIGEIRISYSLHWYNIIIMHIRDDKTRRRFASVSSCRSFFFRTREKTAELWTPCATIRMTKTPKKM